MERISTNPYNSTGGAVEEVTSQRYKVYEVNSLLFLSSPIILKVVFTVH